MQEKAHRTAVIQALIVTFLWSTSWVLIKLGLDQIPALTFASLRYSLAFLALLPFILHPKRRNDLRRLSSRDWLRLALLGVLLISVTQGAQFIGLQMLPAITVSLVLNFSAPMVALLGIFLIGERPTRLQWGGMLLFLGGVMAYFYPVTFPANAWIGLGIVFLGVIANSLSSILGRAINREGHIAPLTVTVVSMGIGSLVMLAVSLVTEDIPAITWTNWLIIAWLAFVNTAFAFTLWNQTLRTLSAVESSIINGTMLIQIALLAWIFLGEGLTWKTISGLLLAGLGAILVQLRRKPPHSAPTEIIETTSARE